MILSERTLNPITGILRHWGAWLGKLAVLDDCSIKTSRAFAIGAFNVSHCVDLPVGASALCHVDSETPRVFEIIVLPKHLIIVR